MENEREQIREPEMTLGLETSQAKPEETASAQENADVQIQVPTGSPVVRQEKPAAEGQVWELPRSLTRLFVTGLVLAGLVGGVAGWGLARLTGPKLSIGYVDGQRLMNEYAPVKAAQRELEQARMEAEKRFAAEAKGKDQKTQAALQQKYLQELETRNKELSSQVDAQIKTAVKKVAQEKGLAYVVVKDPRYDYGGVDVTDEVIVSATAKK